MSREELATPIRLLQTCYICGRLLLLDCRADIPRQRPSRANGKSQRNNHMKIANLTSSLAIWIVALMLFPVVIFAEEADETVEQSADKKNAPATSFEEQLLAIAKTYEDYGRVDAVSRWASTFCRAPIPSVAQLSESEDQETHGQKLYFLFAKYPSSYLAAASDPSPVGQVIVKESWHPKQIADDDSDAAKKNLPLGIRDLSFTHKNGKSYQAEHMYGTLHHAQVRSQNT